MLLSPQEEEESTAAAGGSFISFSLELKHSSTDDVLGDSAVFPVNVWANIAEYVSDYRTIVSMYCISSDVRCQSTSPNQPTVENLILDRTVC